MKIPQCSPGAGYFSRKNEIDQAVLRVLESQWYILGKEVSEFETEFARWNGNAGCVGVANGTDAIELILRACDVGPGDDVITVPNTAVATVSAIRRTGAAVRFADIEEAFFTMDPAALEAELQKKAAKAVVAVHLFGGMADMENISAVCRKYGALLIEDCAQAHGCTGFGAKAGANSGAKAGAFSFYPTKNLGALGDGGAVVSNDPELVQRCRELRQYGWKERYISSDNGINSRLDELQAAILRVNLKYLDQENRRRREIAAFYRAAFAGLDVVLPQERPGTAGVYHQFVIRCKERDALKTFLAEQEVGTAIHYPVLIHKQEPYKNGAVLPVAEKLNEQILSLPMFAQLKDEEIVWIAEKVRQFFGR